MYFVLVTHENRITMNLYTYFEFRVKILSTDPQSKLSIQSLHVCGTAICTNLYNVKVFVFISFTWFSMITNDSQTMNRFSVWFCGTIDRFVVFIKMSSNTKCWVWWTKMEKRNAKIDRCTRRWHDRYKRCHTVAQAMPDDRSRPANYAKKEKSNGFLFVYSLSIWTENTYYLSTIRRSTAHGIHAIGSRYIFFRKSFHCWCCHRSHVVVDHSEFHQR